MSLPRLADLMPTTYRPDLGILVSRWTQQPPPAQLRPIYDELTALALEHKARFWLQDIRHRASNDPEITRWLLDTYFLEMAGRLGGRLHIAYLASPVLLDAIRAAPDFVSVGAYQYKPFAINFFNAEGAAYDWLTQERRADLTVGS